METRFQHALDAMRAELRARSDVTALLFSGSVQRGEGKPSSDLDLNAITLGSERWSECRWVEGVEVQVQFAPLRVWQQQVASLQAVVLHAFTTGDLLFDKTGEAADLKLRAARSYADGPRALSVTETDRERFILSNQVRDLEDLPEHGVEARMLAGQTVLDSLKAWSAFRRIWVHKKPTVLLRNVRNGDASLAAKVESFYESGSPGSAIVIADSVLDMVGGRIFEFSTPPKSV
ncbi:MAG TPA: hypothetical protein VE913_08785 [Longimicrobium sp.]|nr:hypothetical protein [Longimicrobium sp.]